MWDCHILGGFILVALGLYMTDPIILQNHCEETAPDCMSRGAAGLWIAWRHHLCYYVCCISGFERAADFARRVPPKHSTQMLVPSEPRPRQTVGEKAEGQEGVFSSFRPRQQQRPPPIVAKALCICACWDQAVPSASCLLYYASC